MEFEFDFVLNAWIRNLEVSADNLEEAKKILMSMTLDQIAELGAVKDIELKNIESKELSATYEVLVTNIKLDPAFYEYETEAEREELRNRDFGDFTFKIDMLEGEDLDLLIESELEYRTDLSGVWTFDKKIIKKY